MTFTGPPAWKWQLNVRLWGRRFQTQRHSARAEPADQRFIKPAGRGLQTSVMEGSNCVGKLRLVNKPGGQGMKRPPLLLSPRTLPPVVTLATEGQDAACSRDLLPPKEPFEFPDHKAHILLEAPPRPAG